MTDARAAIYRTLCFHEAWKYAPTPAELLLTLDTGNSKLRREEVLDELHALNTKGKVIETYGRVAFPESASSLLQEIRARDYLQARKRRRARLVAKWLSRMDGVRFVAIANTTSLGHARDSGDLDFFVIVRSGSIWTSRLFGAGVFKLLGWLPKDDEPDAVCLSYFISDSMLDLRSHMLQPDDPYFRQWFLALLPLYDDGISSALWTANADVRRRHPFARQWATLADGRWVKPRVRIPAPYSVEKIARTFQYSWFPKHIQDRMNRDTSVMVSDLVLKFHTRDGRDMYRDRYHSLCAQRGVEDV